MHMHAASRPCIHGGSDGAHRHRRCCRYGADTKRVKLDGGIEKDELMALFREKFGLKDKDKPKGDALYLVSIPSFLRRC